jgi:hypothetical protein
LKISFLGNYGSWAWNHDYSFFLIFTGISFFWLLKKEKTRKRVGKKTRVWLEKGNRVRKKRKTVEAWLDAGKRVYIGRSHLMTPTERGFYFVLQKNYPEKKYIIFAQVRVMDILLVNWKEIPRDSFEEVQARHQVDRWHVDYLITDKKFKIVCAIELDDVTHQKEERIRRDKILDAAFRSAGVRLLRHKLF